MAGLQTLEETVHCTLAAGGSGDLLVREFVWGDRFPEPVAMVTHGPLAGPSAPSATSVYYYLPDILGSVLALADAAGNLVERYGYDPYGKTLIERHETGGAWTATAASSFGNPFAWTGQRYDAPVGLYHFLFRSYSPTLGRWLQRDPAGYVDGVNSYELVSSTPSRYVDPLGLDGIDPFAGFDELRRTGQAGGAGAVAANTNQLKTRLAQTFIDATDGAHAAMNGVAHPIETVQKTQDAATAQFHRQIEEDRISGNGDVSDDELLRTWFSRNLFAGDSLLNAKDGRGSEGEIYTDAERVRFALHFLQNTLDLISALEAVQQVFCFAEGTPIATEHGSVRIERIHPGDRVLATHDDPDPERFVAAEWALVTTEMPDPDGDGVMKIDAIRPRDSVSQFRPGDQLPVAFPEFGVAGYARIKAISPCPAIAPGCGRVVLATISRMANDGVRLSLKGEADVIELSAGHRVFSADRDDWVEASELFEGEHVRTHAGVSIVRSVDAVQHAVRVYNLQVDGDHCYFAGSARVLSHNGAICNPFGSKGKLDHQNAIERMVNQARKEHPGMDVIRERKLRGTSRRPDIQILDPNSGQLIKVIEVERNPAGSYSIRRECEYSRRGIPHETVPLKDIDKRAPQIWY